MELRLFLVGFGNVGQGFARLLASRREWLIEEAYLSCRVVAITDWHYGTCIHPRGIDLEEALEAIRRGHSLSAKAEPTLPLIQTLEYDVLIELTPTNFKTGEPAYRHIRCALERGRHVITTNKGPMAHFLLELEELARRKGVCLGYEGTVLAGTPLIRLIRSHLRGAKIQKIEGIVNGTCNYILTRMAEGLDYHQALKEAQKHGYAEADPTVDVEGWDTAAKLMILSQVAFSRKLDPTHISRTGITGIRSEDIRQAGRNGGQWRLIGRLEAQKGHIRAVITPETLPGTHPLAHVKGTTNAVTIHTDCLSPITIMGPGAGRLETGFAVFSDLLQIHQRLRE